MSVAPLLPLFAPAPVEVALTILGPPTTKKNHGQIVHSGPKCGGCGRGRGRPFMLPSAPSKAWTKKAVKQLRERWGGRPAITTEVNCRALFYRERAVGDAVNFYQALADALEEAGVVADDKLVVSWDGSRLRKDAANPRVVLVLSDAMP